MKWRYLGPVVCIVFRFCTYTKEIAVKLADISRSNKHPLISLFVSKFNDFIDIIYPEEVKLRTLHMLDLYPEFDSQFYTWLWQTLWLWFHCCQICHILSIIIPEYPAYGVFVSKIRCARVRSKYADCLFRGYILISKLHRQGYYSRKLQTTFRKFMVVIQTLFTNTFESHMLMGLFINSAIWHLMSLPLGSSFHPFIIYSLHNLSVYGLMTG